MEKDFLNKDLNYEYYKFNETDYNDFLFALQEYKIEYQDLLNIDSNITFGIEIEYEKIKKEIIDNFINNKYQNWTSTSEQTICKGGEIISPILNDNKNTWKDIKNICMFLKENNALMDNEAGGHIHIGTSIIGDNIQKWRNFLGLYSAFEDIIYRFASGERINQRRNMKAYAYPISIDIAKNYQSILNTNNVKDLNLVLNIEHRFQGLNFNNVNFYNPNEKEHKNTIEFRMPNGTKEEIIWQNNINFFAHMINIQINNDYLSYINNEINYIKENYYNYTHYNYIDPKKALLLADIIFDNNLYKTNFIKQYLKDLKTTDKTTPVYAKKFIKTT